jgi:REP-associated tyrosine transposase
MPRPPRLYLPGLPQHVTQRGNNRQACFYADEDYHRYLELLGRACQTHDCSLHAWVLMTNHVHPLLTPGQADSIPLVIRDVGRDYVRIINRTYRRTGTLWEGRYKSSLVDVTDIAWSVIAISNSTRCGPAWSGTPVTTPGPAIVVMQAPRTSPP